MVTDPKRRGEPLAVVRPDTETEPPMSDSVFTRLSGRKKNQAKDLVRFLIVAIIIAAIGLIALYFGTGPH